jgi:predicted chitinase
MGYALDPQILRHLWPKAPQAKIDRICAVSSEIFDLCEVHDISAIAQLMANISHECGAGTIVRESGRYRPDRLVQVFGAPQSSAGVTPEEAQVLVHDEVALFERVYNVPGSPKLAKELGNYQPGDGYKYRGGGDLQLTGRGSYTRIGNLTGYREIIANPDLLADPEISFKVAVTEFATIPGCLAAAKARNTALVRRKVNGGVNGLAEVQVWVRKWEEALPEIEQDAWPPRGSDSGADPILKSKIIKGAATGAATTAGGVLSQIGSATDTANDTMGKVQTTIDHAGKMIEGGKTIVHTVQPFLGLMPQVWLGIGIACAVAALAALGYVAYQRYLIHRNKGV